MLKIHEIIADFWGNPEMMKVSETDKQSMYCCKVANTNKHIIVVVHDKDTSNQS